MNSLPLIASVVSLFVQALKSLMKDRLPDEIYPVFAIILGIGASLALKGTVLQGIDIGLASMGIYAVAKHSILSANKLMDR